MRIAPFVGECLALATKALFTTLRLEWEGRDTVLPYEQAGRPIVLVGWHSHDLLHLGAFRLLFPHSRGAIIVRDSPAGHVLGRAAARLCVDPITLSLEADSGRSARGIVRFVGLVRDGRIGLLAVDGPDGPALQVKPGAAFIALRAGAILIPCATAARPAARLRRWDRHLVPFPFARVVVVLGAPIDTSPRDDEVPSVESLTREIAAGLDRVGERATTLREAQRR